MTDFSGRELRCERAERVVFDRLDFRLPGGAALELRGRNGSGKSSLLRMMAGLLRPAHGTLAWNGLPIGEDRDAHRARVNYVGHLDGLKGALSVAENLNFWMALDPAAARARRERIDLALSAFGLAHLADTPARYLSAGQRRRAALARLIVRPAPLWLLDEPATALDTDAAAALDHVLAAHLGAGGMVVLSTHEPSRGTAPRIELDTYASVVAA